MESLQKSSWCSNSRVLDWLEELDTDTAIQNCPANCSKLNHASTTKIPPTPPMSTSPSKRISCDGDGNNPATPRPTETSPSKRRRILAVDDDGDGDNLETPRPTIARNQNPQLAPMFRNLNVGQSSPSVSGSQDSRSVTSGTSRRSKRSTSPIKRTVDLKFLAKSVSFVSYSQPNQLPDNTTRDLCQRIRSITRFKKSFIHPAARAVIHQEVADGKEWPDEWFRTAEQEAEQDVHEFQPWADIGEDVTLLARMQLKSLSKIRASAAQALARSRGELAWNNLVHTPLLQLVTTSVNGVICEPVMNASIAKSWLPEMAQDTIKDKETSTAKMVDYALTLDLLEPRPADQQLAQAVETIVRTQPEGARSINQTNYEPLALNPIGISIETKSLTGTPIQGNIQLGIWTAAWHCRVRALFALSLPPDQLLPTLPLIFCQGHAWHLYFACDWGQRIEIVGPISLGDTESLDSIYTLFASLRELCKWVAGPFRDWWLSVLGVEAANS